MAEVPAGVIQGLRTLRRAWPTGTDMLVIEVHSRSNRSRWDLVAYPMHRDGTQVGGVTEVIVSDLILHNSTPSEVAALVGQWSKVAGLDRLDLPTYVAPHDYWQSFEVRGQSWVEDTEIYS